MVQVSDVNSSYGIEPTVFTTIIQAADGEPDGEPDDRPEVDNDTECGIKAAAYCKEKLVRVAFK